MSTTFSLVVYVNPPHARPNRPSTIRIIPSVLFTAGSLGGGSSAAISRCHAPDPSSAETCVVSSPAHQLLKHLFNLPDLLLDFACELLRLAFVRQIRVVGGLPCFFFHFAFQFVKLAFELVLRARFHVFSSCVGFATGKLLN